MFSLIQEDDSYESEEESQYRDHDLEEFHCDLFKKGSIVDTKLVLTENIDSFYFYTKQLDDGQRELIKTAPEFRPRARPHTTRPGDIKIYASPDKVGRRCKILDLYSRAHFNKLQVYTEIFLIDEARFMKNINLSNIYDLPQPLDGVEPEVMHARLDCLGYESGANEFFLSELKDSSSDVKLKIIGLRDGTYIVDILHNDESLVEKLNETFPFKVQSPTSDSKSLDETDSAIIPDFASINSQHSQIFNNPKFVQEYMGAKQFFSSQFLRSGTNLRDPEIGRYLFRVKLLYWYQPWSIYIVPDSLGYVENYKTFRDTLDRLSDSCVSRNEMNLVYRIGQICFINNEFDSKLGKWLRGVVLKTPSPSCHGKTRHVRINNTQSPDKLIYRVRSIDFGFELLKSAKDLRPVRKEKLFYSKSSWALGCRLFGVYPQPKSHKKGKTIDQFHTDICIDMIDSWVRERIENEVEGSFYVVFQAGLERNTHQDILNPRTYITLFHRYESTYDYARLSPANNIGRYSCLNTFLVENGYASQYDYLNNINSKLLSSQTSGNLIIKDYK